MNYRGIKNIGEDIGPIEVTDVSDSEQAELSTEFRSTAMISHKKISRHIRVMCTLLLGAFMIQGMGCRTNSKTVYDAEALVNNARIRPLSFLFDSTHYPMDDPEIKNLVISTLENNPGLILRLLDRLPPLPPETLKDLIKKGAHATSMRDVARYYVVSLPDEPWVLQLLEKIAELYPETVLSNPDKYCNRSNAKAIFKIAINQKPKYFLDVMKNNKEFTIFRNVFGDEIDELLEISKRKYKQALMDKMVRSGSGRSIFNSLDAEYKRDKDLLRSLFRSLSSYTESCVISTQEGRNFRDCPDPNPTDWEWISKGLAELDIDFPERFSREGHLSEIISNRLDNDKGDKKDSRPLAILIFNKEDYNGAFAMSNGISALIRNGYKVMYFEANDEDEAFKVLKGATIDIGRTADLLSLNGHGTRTRLSLGRGRGGGKKAEKFYIDTSDERDLMGLRECLSEQSTIILHSCSTGKGRDRANNLANTMGRAFPQSTVFAPTIPTSCRRYVYNREGRVVDVDYIGGEGIKYVVNPKNTTD